MCHSFISHNVLDILQGADMIKVDDYKAKWLGKKDTILNGNYRALENLLDAFFEKDEVISMLRLDRRGQDQVLSRVLKQLKTSQNDTRMLLATLEHVNKEWVFDPDDELHGREQDKDYHRVNTLVRKIRERLT